METLVFRMELNDNAIGNAKQEIRELCDRVDLGSALTLEEEPGKRKDEEDTDEDGEDLE